VLAYFGYLLAHEHDAEHAVQAGLALGGAEAHDRAGVPLQMRVGIATGLVLVGDLISAGVLHRSRRSSARRAYLAACICTA
jgi:class 3 adenylate cyclase